uniref:Uncharacterized protein n=1 Tax=Salix viminalis TaxID=40686 RepID=A0A6N2K695_SALVM
MTLVIACQHLRRRHMILLFQSLLSLFQKTHRPSYCPSPRAMKKSGWGQPSFQYGEALHYKQPTGEEIVFHKLGLCFSTEIPAFLVHLVAALSGLDCCGFHPGLCLTALLLFLLAIFNPCTIITRFTRLAGELFGMPIAVLFIQETVKLIRRKMAASAKESIEQKASNSEIYGNMRAVLIEVDSSPINTVIKELEDLKEAEYRIRLILRSTLMPTCLSEVLEAIHASFVESVPFKYHLPTRLFPGLFWCDMDSDSRNLATTAVLYSHQHKTAHPSPYFSFKTDELATSRLEMEASGKIILLRYSGFCVLIKHKELKSRTGGALYSDGPTRMRDDELHSDCAYVRAFERCIPADGRPFLAMFADLN